MPAPSITTLPPPPLRSQSPTTFSGTAETFVEALPDMVVELNAFIAYLNGLALSGVTGPITATALTMATARLLGRTSGSSGTIQEISVSSPLSFSGGALGLTDANVKPTEYLEIALSDEVTALTTGDGKASWFYGYDFTITEIYIGLGGAVSSSGAVTVDVNKNGSTILSTKASIDSGERTSLTGTQAVIATATSSKGDYFTADIDAAGTGAKGLKLIVVGHRT